MHVRSRDSPRGKTKRKQTSMEPVCKKLKLANVDTQEASKNGHDDAAQSIPSDRPPLPFQDFSLDRVLFTNPKSKLIAVLGTFPQSVDDQGVIVAEKQPLTDSNLESIFSTKTQATRSFQNDIYSQYVLHCPDGVGALKVMSVYPATEAHIKKYDHQALIMVHETPEDYFGITKPFVESHPFSIEWVYNILDGKSEADRVVYNDPHPDTGFVLLPDMKWDQNELENLYMLAVVRRRGILSLRELTQEHLPLLRNVLHKGKEAIKERYGLPEEELRCYLHYQPSYYHLHVHFTHLKYDAPKIQIGQSHLLDDVIDNIDKIDSSYYQKKTISFILKELSPLWQEFKKNRR